MISSIWFAHKIITRKYVYSLKNTRKYLVCNLCVCVGGGGVRVEAKNKSLIQLKVEVQKILD